MRPTTPEIDDEQWDPSHGIEDILLQRKKENTPGEYLGPELFTTRKREQQALGNKRTGSKAKKSQTLWKTITGEEVTNDTTPTEKVDTVHLLDMALKRRGMLLETTGLMSFQKHDEWRRRLFASMQQEPTCSNESAPGITHILNADKKIWSLLNGKCEAGTQATNQGRPMDAHITRTFSSYQVKTLLAIQAHELVDNNTNNQGTSDKQTGEKHTTNNKRRAISVSTRPSRNSDEKAATIAQQAKEIANLKRRLQTQEDQKINPTEKKTSTPRPEEHKSSRKQASPRVWQQHQ